MVVGGLPVAVLDRQQTARLTISAALSRRRTQQPCLFFTTVNGQVVSLAASRPAVRRMFEAADLISADGMSVVLASRLGHAAGLPERVATTDAFHDAAQFACQLGASFYFFGGDEESNRLAVERVRAIYPRLAVVGRRSGYFDPRDESDIVDEINAAEPDVLWIGLGVPLQQEFIQRYLRRLTNVGVAKSCGGLFDFLSGRNRRAPQWMQKSGMEWAYRVMQEPARLGWRYLTTNPHAAYWLVRSRGPASDGTIAVDAVLQS
jgi:exopolysaccharide biosynthesis WecB/TagA/CpsF family protein